MHNASGLATWLPVSPPWYSPRPGVGASDPRSTTIDCHCQIMPAWAILNDWHRSSFDKFSSLLISFIIVNKWFNSVISRDRSAIVRFCRRAEHFKSFSIAISTQKNYFHSKWSQQTIPRLFLNWSIAPWPSTEQLKHCTAPNRIGPICHAIYCADRHLKVKYQTIITIKYQTFVTIKCLILSTCHIMRTVWVLILNNLTNFIRRHQV